VRKLVIGSPTDTHTTTREQRAYEFLQEHELFKKLSRNILMKLIHHVGVIALENVDNEPVYLYEKGKPERHMTLIIEGKVEVSKGFYVPKPYNEPKPSSVVSSSPSTEHIPLDSTPSRTHKKRRMMKEHKTKVNESKERIESHDETDTFSVQHSKSEKHSPASKRVSKSYKEEEERESADPHQTLHSISSPSEEWETLSGPLILGVEALTEPNEFFVPNFTARIVGKVHILKISRQLYEASLKATQLEKEFHEEVSFSFSFSFSLFLPLSPSHPLF
jgi:hypothetical protein